MINTSEKHQDAATYSEAAIQYAGQLLDMMTEQAQLPGMAMQTVSESIREDIRSAHPDRLVLSADFVYRFDRIAAIRGAGYTVVEDAPRRLLSRISDNDDFFWKDTMTQGDEYHLSTRTFAMTRERFIERLAHRYDVIGKVSQREYAEYDTKEEIQ